MGILFRKRIKIVKGVHLNVSKSGTSLSVGPRGAKVTIGRKGVYTNVGISVSELVADENDRSNTITCPHCGKTIMLTLTGK